MSFLIFFGIYLILLFVLAFISRAKSVKTSKDFFLANGQLGLLILFFTFFATQYSGNTFMGFPGKTYRLGYGYMMSVTFMVAIVTCYCFFAPKLKSIALKENFITPSDWIYHRYKSKSLSLTCSVIMIFALLNFLLAQLIAMGHAFEGLTEGKVPYAVGVLFLAAVILIYETLGGMRAIAWTDVVQGFLMFFGFLLIGGYFLFSGDLFSLPEKILQIRPEAIAVPDSKLCLTWLSSIVIVGIGGAMYPQAIQRIYAASSMKSLKQSLVMMSFVPLFTVFFAYLVGLFAIVEFPGLSTIESDAVMARVLSNLSTKGVLLSFSVAMLSMGALTAIMSTADSVLLSITSMIVFDGYKRISVKDKPDTHYLKLGKITSCILMLVMVILALSPDWTLWRLLEIKFQILIQVAVPFILGFYIKDLNPRVLLAGVILGCLVALAGEFLISGKFYGIHFGVIGLIFNIGIVFLGRLKFKPAS